jgi:hypothetical protein
MACRGRRFGLQVEFEIGEQNHEMEPAQFWKSGHGPYTEIPVKWRLVNLCAESSTCAAAWRSLPGGNRGIGRALAIALAQAGAAIAIMARDEARNREALADLRALGVPALTLKVDLMKRADLKPAMDEVERALGPVDILVNNAAFAILRGVLDRPRRNGTM